MLRGRLHEIPAIGWAGFAVASLFILCGIVFLSSQTWVALLIPFGFLAILTGVMDYRLIFLTLWFTIPFSIEVDLPGGFSTDFPDEPLMWVCCFLLPVFIYLNHRKLRFDFVFHPLLVILFIHLAWIILTSVTAQEPIIALKFTLAKCWYLVCCILLPLWLFRDLDDVRKWSRWLLTSLGITIVIILARHALTGFSFDTINNAVIPIYRNHVDYACCLALLLPFAWMMRNWSERVIEKWLYTGLILVILAGIYFSYTRAAWACVPFAIAMVYIIRLRLMRILIPIALGCGILVVGWLQKDNRYLEFSPNYDRAITHKHFGDMLSATSKLEDISTVERLYRWIGGYYMVKEKPILGFGPGGFYPAYHAYTDRHFSTYVSDNPEHSGIHNYYLMTAVEQGLPGLLIWIILVAAVIIYGENLYKRLPKGKYRELLMVALVSFSCNLIILMVNDTVETDKIGTFLFICIALLIWIEMQTSSKQIPHVHE